MRMSSVEASRIPSLTLGWRLKLALSHADMKAEDMAEALGVSRQTLSRWMADKGAPPKRAYLAAWAMATDVSLDWLMTGAAPQGPPTPTPQRDDELMQRWAEKGRGRRRRGDVTVRYPTPALAAA